VCCACVAHVLQVGGNGGNAGANAIQQKCEDADVLCNVIGVPKSIDNDILLIDKCFGFDTAVEEAQRALLAAKVEASSAKRGIGLVKLMGRQSGFIAMQASMASGEGGRTSGILLTRPLLWLHGQDCDTVSGPVMQYASALLADSCAITACGSAAGGKVWAHTLGAGRKLVAAVRLALVSAVWAHLLLLSTL
jgi:hypothetical protein